MARAGLGSTVGLRAVAPVRAALGAAQGGGPAGLSGADTSLFPTALGVNPMLTVMALA
jgi:hypothetical protein